MLYRTRNGALCVPTKEIPLTREVIRRPKEIEVLLGTDFDYIQVQMQPPVPQRLEWVHKNNLTKVK